jgi:hypothetical protein
MGNMVASNLNILVGTCDVRTQFARAQPARAMPVRAHAQSVPSPARDRAQSHAQSRLCPIRAGARAQYVPVSMPSPCLCPCRWPCLVRVCARAGDRA